ncbi:MAG: hypothetical protein V3R33_00885 [Anaerolineales bacterium]
MKAKVDLILINIILVTLMAWVMSMIMHMDMSSPILIRAAIHPGNSR